MQGTLHSKFTRVLIFRISPQDAYKITALPGDGIGPEIMEATKKVCIKVAEKHGFKIEFTDALIGGAALDACDDPFPVQILRSTFCVHLNMHYVGQ